jgi:F420-0:gamma-glutamyl ligase
VEPARDIRGKPDLFGREIQLTKVDMIDALSGMAVLAMGESNECTPVVIARGDFDVVFSNTASMDGFKIDMDEDIYKPLIKVIPEV